MKLEISTDPVVKRMVKLSLENPDVPFEFGEGTTFINLKTFYEFISENAKDGGLFDEYMKDLIEHDSTIPAGECGHYELRAYETRSHRPEVITYERQIEEDEASDSFRDKFIF